MGLSIFLYRDDEGLKYAAFSKLDDWHQGHTVVPSRGYAAFDVAYMHGIAALNAAWNGLLEIKAGVPDDADRKKHPISLSETELSDILKRIG